MTPKLAQAETAYCLKRHCLVCPCLDEAADVEWRPVGAAPVVEGLEEVAVSALAVVIAVKRQ